MNEELKVMEEGLSEEEVLLVASDTADADEVAEVIELRAECCVDHLCGCK